MAQSQWIVLLAAAAVAAVVMVRLFLVLGRRSGTDFPALPPAGTAPPPDAPPAPMPQLPAARDAPGLFEVQMADKNFDAEKFLTGARSAYGLVVTAFEKGDTGALKPLVSPDVLEGFAAAIMARGAAPQRFHFASVRHAAIDHAVVTNGLMEITVRFDAVFETAEALGAPHEITDRWTFSRTAGASDPNWTLVATSGDAA
jgi:predicted lipid-binding transport protein (Tim44 family)